MVSQPHNLIKQIAEIKWKSSEKSHTLDSTYQAGWTVLQRKTNPAGSVTAYQERIALTYDREVKDLVFFYRASYGYIDIDLWY